MKRLALSILAGILGGILLFGTFAAIAGAEASHQTPATVDYVAWHEPEPSPAAQCQEDEPCWDCHTMGNRICGPIVETPAAVETPEAVAPVYVAPAPVAVPAQTVHVVGTPVASPSPSPAKAAPAPVTVQTVPSPTPSATPHPSNTCPPLLHKDGVNIAPKDAPANCVYAQ